MNFSHRLHEHFKIVLKNFHVNKFCFSNIYITFIYYKSRELVLEKGECSA